MSGQQGGSSGSTGEVRSRFASIEPRILDKWVKIASRMERALNEPAPVDALDGIGMLLASAAAAIQVGINDLSTSESRSKATARFGETETIVAKFFDEEMTKSYAATGSTPFDVSGSETEIEGNPTYKVFGYIVGSSRVLSEVCLLVLSTNETIEQRMRIANAPRLVQVPTFYTRNYDRMINLMGKLNFPPVGIVDRIGVACMTVSDTIDTFMPQIDPTNAKTASAMIGGTQMFLAKMMASQVRETVDRPACVLGALGGVAKVAVDVCVQTMEVIERQQAAGGLIQPA